MSVYSDTDFDLSEMEVVWMKWVRCKLTDAEGSVFRNLLKAEGWVELNDLAVNIKGEAVQSVELGKLIAAHISHIRRKLKAADIPIMIQNQRTSFWMTGAYRLAYEANDDRLG